MPEDESPGTAMVVEPMTTCVACGAKLMRVPDIVIAFSPGVRVWSPITYSDAELRVAVAPASVKTGASFPECCA